MRITVTDKLVARTVAEGSAVTFTVKFYADSSEPWTLTAPTTIRYRLDNPETGEQIIDWTTVSPASSVSITIAGTANTLVSYRDRARRELLIEADAGLSTQYRKTHRFWVSTNAVEAA